MTQWEIVGEWIKKLFCRHKETYFKPASEVEKYHHVYGHIICRKCGKEVSKITLDNM